MSKDTLLIMYTIENISKCLLVSLSDTWIFTYVVSFSNQPLVHRYESRSYYSRKYYPIQYLQRCTRNTGISFRIPIPNLIWICKAYPIPILGLECIKFWRFGVFLIEFQYFQYVLVVFNIEVTLNTSTDMDIGITSNMPRLNRHLYQ